MKPFLGKNFPSVLFVLSITIFGGSLALVLLGNQSDKEQLGSYIVMGSMFLLAISMYFTILKKNRTFSE